MDNLTELGVLLGAGLCVLITVGVVAMAFALVRSSDISKERDEEDL